VLLRGNFVFCSPSSLTLALLLCLHVFPPVPREMRAAGTNGPARLRSQELLVLELHFGL